MRDLLFLGVFFTLIPFCLRRAWLGVLLWVWISLMNPHRFAYGIAYTFPVAKIAAVVTVVAFVFDRTRGKLPKVRETWLLVLWLGYLTFTTFFAMHPDRAWLQWDRVAKIQMMTLLALFLFQDEKKIRWLLLTVALSVGFFGFKGGIFSLLTAGSHRVFGPPDSFITDNNALALAEIMVLPLLLYVGNMFENKWLRRGMYLVAALTVISAIFSYSRGALLSLCVVGAFFLWSSNKKWMWAPIIVIAVALILAFVPDQWFARMSTIKSYDQDASALGRINAWWFAVNLAVDRPFLGGGFKAFTTDLFYMYAPDPYDVHDAHSIYFEVLGEHGFVALGIFLAILASSLTSLYGIHRATRKIPELQWVSPYVKMLGMSLAAYATGGAFLGLAYFDLYYYLVVAVVSLKVIVSTHPAVARKKVAAVKTLAPSAAGIPARPVAAPGAGNA